MWRNNIQKQRQEQYEKAIHVRATIKFGNAIQFSKWLCRYKNRTRELRNDVQPPIISEAKQQ
jgi:hypothetical protein